MTSHCPQNKGDFASSFFLMWAARSCPPPLLPGTEVVAFSFQWEGLSSLSEERGIDALTTLSVSLLYRFLRWLYVSTRLPVETGTFGSNNEMVCLKSSVL